MTNLDLFQKLPRFSVGRQAYLCLKRPPIPSLWAAEGTAEVSLARETPLGWAALLASRPASDP